MTTRIVAIIQARMASSRLPGKVLLDLAGTPMLGRVVERTRQARSTEAVVVATTDEPSDDPIVEYCEASRIDVVRGSHYDVLDRYYAAAQAMEAGIVIRITADCPLIDPGLIDDTVVALLGRAGAGSGSSGAQAATFDFAANRLPPPWRRTYPIGLDTEACTFAALATAWREAKQPVEREHVMPFLYEGVQLRQAEARLWSGTSSHGFRVALLNHTEDLGSMRWTVDTGDDLEFVRRVLELLSDLPTCTWLDVVDLLKAHPELAEINASVKHKTLWDVDARGPATKDT
jgi:spore coat polysaccharide biosynthesis protein SpsF